MIFMGRWFILRRSTGQCLKFILCHERMQMCNVLKSFVCPKWRIANDIKEKLCFVKTDSDREGASSTSLSGEEEEGVEEEEEEEEDERNKIQNLHC